MRVEARGAVRSKTLRGRLFSAPTLVVLASLSGLALGAFLIGVMVGAYFIETDNEDYIEFLTESSFSQNVVHDGLSWAKAMADGENVPGNFARGVIAADKAPKLTLDIKHRDFQRLALKREQALEQGILFAEAGDYVPATLTSDGDAARVKLRLKGDLPDHYETDKWSLRIRVRGDETFQGMKRFSIQHPQTRNYLGEWVFMEALRREGLIAPRYDFVEVTINGERKGIYALEEHFEKRLLEHAERREGPILRFFEDLKWVAESEDYDQEEYGSFSSSPIEGYATDASGHGSEFERAASLLEAFRRGELTTSEVFDTKKLAVFLAMRDLCGAGGASWQNFRFYYDPVTSKLEPIAFDSEVDIHDPIRKLFSFDGGVMHKATFYEDLLHPDDPIKLFLADLGFFELYVRELDRLSGAEYWDGLMAELGPELGEKLAVLHRDYPFYGWSEKAFRKNGSFIRSALAPPRAVLAYHEVSDDGAVTLRVGNIQSLPVEILGLSRPGEEALQSGDDLVLRSKRRHQPVDYVSATFRVPDSWGVVEGPDQALALHYRLLGTPQEHTVEVYPWNYTVDRLASSDWIRDEASYLETDWIVADEEAATLRLAPGSHVLGQSLVLPEGYDVIAGPGVRIDLRAGARIISRSRLYFMGSEDQPVRIESRDGTGQGLVVFDVPETSVLSHVRFESLDAPRGDGWGVLAGVTFYEAPVEMSHVSFEGARSEDALNVMRTRFVLEKCTFVNSSSDAFDGDFVTGKIEQCHFVGSGNDALDFSGSHVEIVASRVEGAGDKALSAGERSDIVAREMTITGAEIAVTSKDLSSVSFIDGTIRDSRVAFCAFQKKAEFGAGSVAIVRSQVSGAEREYLIEEGSRVTRDGDLLEGSESGVAELLYGAEYGRASD